MSWILAAIVSFGSITLLMTHFTPRAMRRVAGYAMPIDFVLHGTILWMFFGTSTLGLIQAEAAGILFSIGLRAWRWAFGYERLVRWRWVGFDGALTRFARR